MRSIQLQFVINGDFEALGATRYFYLIIFIICTFCLFHYIIDP